jgi:hypothetical protein
MVYNKGIEVACQTFGKVNDCCVIVLGFSIIISALNPLRRESLEGKAPRFDFIREVIETLFSSLLSQSFGLPPYPTVFPLLMLTYSECIDPNGSPKEGGVQESWAVI